MNLLQGSSISAYVPKALLADEEVWAIPSDTASRSAKAAPLASITDDRPPVKRHPRRLGSGGPGQTVRVVIVIPFRDRQEHLAEFKKYWREFVKTDPSVHLWDIYVAEQFDGKPFNRGWTFNVGLAAALRDSGACPDLLDSLAPGPITCAVIQDIDYLPESGVHYGNCSVPTQLSSEIDRFGGGVPYAQSAGGIVGMSVAHWKQINGFSNDYFGWGGEDDELHHRLRLNNLLWKTLHIYRPPKGHGRFSGKRMHKLFSHPKRIDPKSYDHNLKLLEEIHKATSTRWKQDGLSNLQFRIEDWEEDTTDDEELGITYRLIKTRRGQHQTDLANLPVAIQPNLNCKSGHKSWLWTSLHKPIPWDLAGLRQLVMEAAGCKSSGGSPNFILVDRRLGLAKVLSSSAPARLYSFYRSLADASADGLIIADARSEKDIDDTFRSRSMWWGPPTTFSICYTKWRDIPRYRVFPGRRCYQGAWKAVANGIFRAFKTKSDHPDVLELFYTENKQHDVQRFYVQGQTNDQWAGIKWEGEKHLYVSSKPAAGKQSQMCLGFRLSMQPSTRILPKADCTGEDFKHQFNFYSAPDRSPRPRAAVLHICKHGSDEGELLVLGACGDPDNETLKSIGKITVMRTPRGNTLDQEYTICKRSAGKIGDTICFGTLCCPQGWNQGPRFYLPAEELRESGVIGENARKAFCIGYARGAASGGYVVSEMKSCADKRYEHKLTLWGLSLAAATDATISSLPGGPFLLLQEDVGCTEFICPDNVALLSSTVV